MFEWTNAAVVPLKILADLQEKTLPGGKTFVITGSFGDVYVQSAILREANPSSTSHTVVIDPDYKEFAQMIFGADFQILTTNTNNLRSLLCKIGALGHADHLPILLLPTLYPMIAECIHNNSLNYCDFVRLLIKSEFKGKINPLEDNQNSRVYAQKILEKPGGIVGRSVIVCPNNNTNVPFSENFWDDVCKTIAEHGWVPIINHAGINSASGICQAWPSVSVPPQLAITVTTIAGAYISGTNGFSTIQAIFNQQTAGLHFINATHLRGNYIADNFGNAHRYDIFFHQHLWKNQFLHLQREYLIDENCNLWQANEHIKNMLSASSMRNQANRNRSDYNLQQN